MSAILVIAAAGQLVQFLLATVLPPMFAQHLIATFRYDVLAASVGSDDGLVSLTLISDSKICYSSLI